MTDLLAAPGSWLYLPVAFALGALHALEPGHAKSLMAAFVVANRGTAAQAALLALSAAVSHSLVVWVLVALGFALGEALPLEAWHPWLELAGGLAMSVIAAIMLRNWLRARADTHAPRNPHGHDHQHGHGHDHGHDHAAPRLDRPTGGAIVWFGLTAGLNPCPGAVAVLFLCLKTGSVALGFATVAAFSVGLAAVLIAVGVAASWGIGKLAARRPGDARLAERLQLASLALVGAMTVFVFAHVATHFA